ATHMVAVEVEAIVQAGAIVGVCPTTEANLGDGVFPARRFVGEGGNFGIGSDSHVSVSPLEELRLLEYLQRLVNQQRNVLADDGLSTGRAVAEQVWAAGARACGRPLGKLAAGHRADFLVLNATHPLFESRTGDALLDTLIFAGDPSMIDAVYVGGVCVVSQGMHPAMERAQQRFGEAMRRLLPRLA
ncbi:MAG: amidohydrolase family protein, partial [Planctomycetota bacterium]